MAAMQPQLLSSVLRMVCALLCAGVGALHFGHVIAMRGQPRWWHLGHSVMAITMAGMFVFARMAHPSLYRWAFGLFVLLAVALAGTTGTIWFQDRALPALWAASTVDMAAMAYMLMPASVARPWPLTSLVVTYLVVEALVHVRGEWLRFPLNSGQVFKQRSLRLSGTARNKRD